MAVTPFLAHRERFTSVASTNDVVRAWLAGGTPEVCLAVADEQTAGRGRDGRRWLAPPGAALLVSLGFRPTWLAADRVWRLAAIVSLAMAEAAEEAAGLPAGTVGLKWPNDLVIPTGDPAEPRKVAGVLGETSGLATADPRVVVGLGINVDWAAADFPPELAPTMTSLRMASGGREAWAGRAWSDGQEASDVPEASGGREAWARRAWSDGHEASGGREASGAQAAAGGQAIDRDALLEAFLARLGPRLEALRAGIFDGAAWAARQVTTGRTIRLQTPAGIETLRATGVDPASGALLLDDPAAATGLRGILAGEIVHVRLAEPIAGAV